MKKIKVCREPNNANNLRPNEQIDRLDKER